MNETLELEEEDFQELEDEFEDEDYLELEGEDYLELEDESEDEDYLEMEAEDEAFLGDLGGIVSSVLGGELEDESEDEDYLELEAEDEDFLGDLGGIVSSVLGGELEGPLGELEEKALANSLLRVQSEEELEQFLGGLFKKAARGIGNFARSSTGKALGGMLKGLAKKALPMVGGALGSMVAPGIGTAIGSKLGGMAGGLFELEGEMSEDELEFEVARRVVRIGASAANRAARTAHAGPPAKVARHAIVTATRRHAPAALPASVHPRFRARHPIAVAGRPVRRVPVHRAGVIRPRTTRVGYRTTGGYRRRPATRTGVIRRPIHHRGTTVRSRQPAGYRGTGVRYRGSYRSPAGVVRRPSSGGRWQPRATGYRGRYRTRGPVGPTWSGSSSSGARRYGYYGDGSTAYTASGTWVRRGDRIIVLGV
jgi:hypothetical protein